MIRCTVCGRGVAVDGSVCVVIHDVGRCGYTACAGCANDRVCIGCGALWIEAAP